MRLPRRAAPALLLLILMAVWCMPTARAATTCTATSTSLNFGTTSTSGATDVTANFTVTCTTTGISVLGRARVRMCLNIGDGASGGGNFVPRRMLNGFSDALQFQMYTDPARSQIWGALGNATVPTPLRFDFDYSLLPGASQSRTFTIYGRIPAQTFIAGSYANSFAGVHTSLNYRYNEADTGTPAFPAACDSGGNGGAISSNAFPFTASAIVPANCRAYTTTDLDFGSVAGVITSDVDQTSGIGMICTGRTAWQVGLDDGLHALGGARRMQLGTGANFVTYELYRNAARNSRWGNTLNTDTVQGSGTGAAQTLTVYGRVPASQTPAAGTYGDVITVTITY